MAKADEFRWAAEAVFMEANQIEGVAQRFVAERDNVGIEGAAIIEIVDAAFARIVEEFGWVSETCRDIGDELLHRACCCDDYTDELREWLEEKRRYDELVRNGATPTLPLRPRPEPCCSWCEASI